MLVSAPVLQVPRFGEPFTVECDASKKAISALLIQEGHPVAFASRALNRHEANYPSVEREALGLVYAVKEFEPYIYGSGIGMQSVANVVTDCKALCGFLKNGQIPNAIDGQRAEDLLPASEVQLDLRLLVALQHWRSG
jgi:hypothetical protein